MSPSATCGQLVGYFVLLLPILLCLSLVVAGGDSDDGPSISDATLLLPHATSEGSKISYTITAFNGCFKWSSLNPEIVSIKPLYSSDAMSAKNCASRAVLTPEIVSTERLSTFVKAHDSESGRTLRCEVFLDTIFNITISTTTHTMYRDAVEVLSIQAFDASSNHFSSVEGFRFDWTLTPSPSNVLQIVPFKGASVEVNPIVLAMEEKNLRTSTVLVKGLDFGKVTVTATLSETGYKRISDRVELSVQEPLQLSPTLPIFIAPGAEVPYILQSYPRDRDPTQIAMPDSKYQWSTDNTRVASVDNRGIVRALDLGQARINVRYENINEAKAIVNVVEPSKLGLRLYPVNDDQEIITTSGSCYLISNTTYRLEIDVFDAHDRRLYTTENMNFAVNLPRDIFSVESSTGNKAQHILRTLKEGSALISAELTSIKAYRSFKASPVQKDIIIQSPVRTTPSVVRLPWHEGASHEYALKAVGGSDKYNWYSDKAIISVSPSGLVSAHGVGSVSIKVSDKKNPLNYAYVQVHSLPVSKIAIRATSVETQVGWPLVLPIAVLDSSSNLFNNCSAMPFEWEISDPAVFMLQGPGNPANDTAESCTTRAFLALGEGRCTITVKYGRLVDSITVFAYNPLKVVSPSDGALVALGSTAQLVFEGGPKPWLYEPTAFMLQVVATEPQMVRIQQAGEASAPSRYRFTVTCLKLGDVGLEIQVGNKATKTNKLPALVHATTTLSCQEPQTIFVHPTAELVSDAVDLEDRKQKCMGSLKMPPFEMVLGEASNMFDEFIVKGNRRIPLAVSLINKDRKRFDDFSSLDLSWESTNTALASFLPPSDNDNSKRTLEIKGDEGTVSIRVSITGYNFRQLSPLQVAPILDRNALTRSFTLHVRSNVAVTPRYVAVFNDESNSVALNASGGSGIYNYELNNTQLASVHPSSDLSTAVIIPSRPGVGKVTVRDVCLEGSRPVESTISISEVGAITLNTRDMLRINDHMELQVEVKDQLGTKFSADQIKHMKLSAHTENDIISATKLDDYRFLIRGNALGIGRITVTAETRSGRTISSQPHAIHVFPPLQIRPERLVLLPNGVYQIKWIGGPPVRVSVAFSAANSSVCDVDAKGRVVARAVGSTTLAATAQATDEQGNSHDYGSSLIDVFVRPLSGIRIHSTTNRLVVGTEMTIRVIGPDGETPFTLGAVGITFSWDSSDPSVAAIAPIYKEAGVSLEREHGFSVRVQAKKAGVSRISVTADGTESWTATLQITVVDGLVLFTPAELLLPHASRFSILTNKDSTGKLHYRLLSEQPTAADCQRIIAHGLVHDLEHMTANSTSQIATIEEHGNGLLTTGNISGEAYILVSDDAEQQSAVVKVVVKPVQQLQLLPASTIYDQLPVGATMDFNIILRDDEGRAFSSTGNFEFHYDLDVINIINVSPGKTNSTVQVHALRPGEAILRVYTNTLSIPLDDYVKFQVGHAIAPSEPFVHKGGTIRFSVSDKLKTPGGLWNSDSEKVLSVDLHSGVAVAHHTGKANVYYRGSHVQTFTEASVEQVRKMIVKTVPYITNVKDPNTGEAPDYAVGVTYYSDDSRQFVPSSQIKHNILLDCSVEETEWATASPRQDLSSGEDYCVIQPRDPISLKARFIDKIHLIVRASDAKQTYNTSHREPISYMPAFIVITPPTITIPTGSKTARLEIRSKSNLFITSSDDRIQVRKISSDPNTDKIVYEVVAEDVRDDLHDVQIQLENHYTAQREVVRVNYGETALATQAKRSTVERESLSFLPDSIILVLVTIGALAALAALVLGISWLFRRKQSAQPTASPAARSPSTPFTPRSSYTPNPLSPLQRTPGPKFSPANTPYIQRT